MATAVEFFGELVVEAKDFVFINKSRRQPRKICTCKVRAQFVTQKPIDNLLSTYYNILKEELLLFIYIWGKKIQQLSHPDFSSTNI